MQELAITDIKSVEEVEPAIVEIVVGLLDESTAILRMNALTMQALRQRLMNWADEGDACFRRVNPGDGKSAPTERVNAQPGLCHNAPRPARHDQLTNAATSGLVAAPSLASSVMS